MSISDLYNRFADVHPNIILKTDVLRQGLRISERAQQEFNQRDDILWRGFHLFSYDSNSPKVYKNKIPMGFHLSDGCPVQIRTNDDSPYFIDFDEGAFFLSENNETIAEGLYFDPKPKWYDMKFENGIPLPAVVQGFSGEYMFITINRYCELWNNGDQCLFCDINAFFKAQRDGEEDVVARLEPDVLADALKIAIEMDPLYRLAVIITGGTILGEYRGETELDFYCSRLNAIREKLQVWIPSTFQVDPQDDEGWKRLHDTGIGSVQPNIEVWDENLFNWICPGKSRVIGRDEWIRRTIRGVDFWGRGRVQPNFVIGVEMAEPHGFKDVSAAVKSTSAGWDFLMGHGVLPRYNQWTIESGSAFANQRRPPLEYFIEVQKAYTELRWKHKFDPPFPSTFSRSAYLLCCLYDFEYYHGTGILSKKKQEEMLAAGRKSTD
ncbi:hypothetical protein N9174_00540 [bacterium]|nr:hypothetical protein [bacterium]